jgi:hypothetical protein
MLSALEQIDFRVNDTQAKIYHSVEESALLVYRMPYMYPEEYGYRARTQAITNRDRLFCSTVAGFQRHDPLPMGLSIQRHPFQG